MDAWLGDMNMHTGARAFHQASAAATALIGIKTRSMADATTHWAARPIGPRPRGRGDTAQRGQRAPSGRRWRVGPHSAFRVAFVYLGFQDVSLMYTV